MRSHEIIANIDEIYERFEVEKGLRLHQRRVAGVADLICDTWIGEPLNRDTLVAAALVHDLGSIVKWDLTPRGSLLDEEETNRYREIQKRIRKRYGNDEYQATHAMVEQCKPEKLLLEILRLQQPEHLPALVESAFLEAKIAMYADARVKPQGVASLQERFDDLIRRYQNRGEEHIEKMRKGHAGLIVIESQIFAQCILTSDAITEATIQPYVLKYELNTQTPSSGQ